MGKVIGFLVTLLLVGGLNILSVQSCKHTDIYLGEVEMDDPVVKVYALGELKNREPNDPSIVFVFDLAKKTKGAVEIRGKELIRWEIDDWFRMYPNPCTYFDKEPV